MTRDLAKIKAATPRKPLRIRHLTLAAAGVVAICLDAQKSKGLSHDRPQ